MDCLLHAQHHQSLLCHGSWGRCEGARSILAKSNAIRAGGHHSEGCSHSPWVTTWPLPWVNVSVGDVAEGNVHLHRAFDTFDSLVCKVRSWQVSSCVNLQGSQLGQLFGFQEGQDIPLCLE